MTIEEFAHRCLLIKAGNATLEIPCCANCKYYIPSESDQAAYPDVKKWICDHPELTFTEDAELLMKPEDFCSRWEPRNEEK